MTTYLHNSGEPPGHLSIGFHRDLVGAGTVVANLRQVGRQRQVVKVDGQVRGVVEVEHEAAVVVVVATEKAVSGGVEIHYEF